jgi:hypothetical protein
VFNHGAYRLTPSRPSMEFDWNIGFIRYGERWRLARKMLHAHAHSGVAPKYHPVQLESARGFARDLLAAPPHPDALPDFVRAALGAEIIKMVYGLDVGKSEEARRKYIDSAEEALHAMAIGGTPGRFLVEFIPWRVLRPIDLPRKATEANSSTVSSPVDARVWISPVCSGLSYTAQTLARRTSAGRD